MCPTALGPPSLDTAHAMPRASTVTGRGEVGGGAEPEVAAAKAPTRAAAAASAGGGSTGGTAAAAAVGTTNLLEQAREQASADFEVAAAGQRVL